MEGQSRYWSAEEHQRFLKGVAKYGPRNYSAISECVKTRTAKQVRTHAQKYEMRLAREAARQCGDSETLPYSSPQMCDPTLDDGDAASSPEIEDLPRESLRQDVGECKGLMTSASSMSLAVTSAMSDVERQSETEDLGIPVALKAEVLDDPALPPLPEDSMRVGEADHGETQVVIPTAAESIAQDIPTTEVWKIGRNFSKSDLKSLGNEEWLA